jgi:hypothetical protein
VPAVVRSFCEDRDLKEEEPSEGSVQAEARKPNEPKSRAKNISLGSDWKAAMLKPKPKSYIMGRAAILPPEKRDKKEK